MRTEPGASWGVAALAALVVLGTVGLIVAGLFTAATFLVWVV
jgi:hypothetical protein